MKAEHETGTVKTIRNRANEVVGYQPLLPRSLSRAPRHVANPDRYQEPFGDPCATYEEARRVLDLALPTLRANPLMGRGPNVGDYVRQEIQARFQEARRKYPSESRANKDVSTWRSIERLWLSEAPFIRRSPQSVATSDLQTWFDWLRDEAEGAKGEPLSGAFIRQIAALLKASLGRVVGLPSNPCAGLKLPPKTAPKVPFLSLEAQRVFFGAPAEKIAFRDRVMAGCGMGAALRVNELLAMEATDVHLEGASPHLLVQYGGAERSPTKGRRVRRVELFEPGLGFWRIWMTRFYRPGDRMVFPGARGGYQKHWPEQFPEWSKSVGLPELSSHIMRHTYAVAMLSGTWGYEPRSLDFVSQQLGHGDRQTTERHYGAFEAGVWTREVQRMTGATSVSRGPVTATELLMSGRDSALDSAPPNLPHEMGRGHEPRHSPHAHELAENTLEHASQLDATLQALERALRAAEAGDPRALALLIDAARDAHIELAALAQPAARPARGARG